MKIHKVLALPSFLEEDSIYFVKNGVGADLYMASNDGDAIKVSSGVDYGLTLGESSSTAYQGDRGKFAYDHAQSPHVANQTDIGLGHVNNTSDLNKPVSTATQAALDALTKTDVGLGNVDNTSDVNKPVSTAQQAAIDAAGGGSSFDQDLNTTDSPTFDTLTTTTSVATDVYAVDVLAVDVGATGTVTTGDLEVSGTVTTGAITTNLGLDLIPVANPSTGGVTLINTTGNVDAGNHFYWVTYITALGETNSYMIGNVTTDASNGQVTVTIPVSADPRVTGRKLGRTKAGASNYLTYELTVISDNVTTTFVDNVSDATLTGAASGMYYQINTTNKNISVDGAGVMTVDKNGTHFGVDAGVSLNGGGGNTLFGYRAGRDIVTGTQHVLIGLDAGQGSVSGSSNVAVGSSAMVSVGTGSGNVAIGRNALVTGNADTSNNAIFGYFAFSSGTPGVLYGNVGVGNKAGQNATGSFNIFLGNSAGDNETGSYTILIDNRARGSEAAQRSEALIYGVTSATPANQILNLGGGGNVGIGTITPTEKLDVAGNIKASGDVIVTNFDDGTNYERLTISSQTGDNFLITPEAGGTGVVRGVEVAGDLSAGESMRTPRLFLGTAGNIWASSTRLEFRAAGFTSGASVMELVMASSGQGLVFKNDDMKVSWGQYPGKLSVAKVADGVLGIGTSYSDKTSGSLELANITASGFVNSSTHTVAETTALTGMVAGSSVYVTDETGGSVMATYDGTNWRRSTDRAIIS